MVIHFAYEAYKREHFYVLINFDFICLLMFYNLFKIIIQILYQIVTSRRETTNL